MASLKQKKDMRRCEALAHQIVAVREKFGRYPAVIKEWDPNRVVTRTNSSKHVITSHGAMIVKPCKPLPGKEKLEIFSLPDESKMSAAEKLYYADNRQDYRQRVRKLIPRSARLHTYSRDLRERVNSTRIAPWG
jgi:hypothetical protein